MTTQLEKYAEEFLVLAFEKMAFIKKMPNGKWRVMSEKGKNLGEYDSKSSANNRLRQIEYFKHKKASNDSPTYSVIIRDLKKDHDDKTVARFQSLFKEYFDRYMLEGHEEPERDALRMAQSHFMRKQANAIEMGNPEFAGKQLADLVKFLMHRMPDDRRGKSMESMKRKIYQLNENEIAQKKTPPSSSMGSSLTIIKTILLEHEAPYIRQVLNAIVRNL